MSSVELAASRADGPSFAHLRRLCDATGVFEHAEYQSPRREHGYCVDDVARALIVAARDRSGEAGDLEDLCLDFIESAIAPDGRCHNRRSATGAWLDAPSVDDCWGRALWGTGTAAVHGSDARVRGRAREAFHALSARRSPAVRSMAFAAIGAGELLLSGEKSDAVRRLAEDAMRLAPSLPRGEWGWVEERLRYANASLSEAVIISGAALADRRLLNRGLSMLAHLVLLESHDGHLSVTGPAGRTVADEGPQFDQQPIEVGAIADAAARAFDLTGQGRWKRVVELAWAWFLGDNDARVPMVDLQTGAGYDGLEPAGRNENCGAESTLAALSTWQHAARLGIMKTW